MDWPSDPWTKGSYSFPAPGQVTTQGPTLYDGIGRLHFAGEYTCYAFVGYMEGALNSGAAVAKRIAEKRRRGEEERRLDKSQASKLHKSQGAPSAENSGERRPASYWSRLATRQLRVPWDLGVGSWDLR